MLAMTINSNLNRQTPHYRTSRHVSRRPLTVLVNRLRVQNFRFDSSTNEHLFLRSQQWLTQILKQPDGQSRIAFRTKEEREGFLEACGCQSEVGRAKEDVAQFWILHTPKRGQCCADE